MSLKKETLKKIADLAKIKVEDLEKALKDEKEVEIEIPEGLQVFTAEEIEQRDTNQKNDGIKAGKEIGIKEVRKAAGIEEGGSKDPAKVAQAIIEKGQADAKVKPDEKVTQLTEQVTLLQKSLTEKDGEIAKAQAISSGVALDRKILSAFPKNRNSTLTDEEYLTLLKSSHNFKQGEDGNVLVEKEGKPLRDGKTQNPLTLSEAVTSIFTDRKGWLDAEGGPGGGRGDGDKNTPPVFSKRSEVVAHYEKQGKSLNGADGQEVVAKIAELKKANPEFDMEK